MCAVSIKFLEIQIRELKLRYPATEATPSIQTIMSNGSEKRDILKTFSHRNSSTDNRENGEVLGVQERSMKSKISQVTCQNHKEIGGSGSSSLFEKPKSRNCPKRIWKPPKPSKKKTLIDLAFRNPLIIPPTRLNKEQRCDYRLQALKLLRISPPIATR